LKRTEAMKRLTEINKEISEDINLLLNISTAPLEFEEIKNFRQESDYSENFDLVKEKDKLDLRMKISFLEREIYPVSLFEKKIINDPKKLQLLEILKKELKNLGSE